MRVATLFSGGKDSTYAIYQALQKGHELKFLITLAPKREDSWMFHSVCIELTKLQAEAMGVKQIWKETSGEKEKELEDLTVAISEIADEVDGIVSGALASQYQKERVDAICKKFGLESITPSWHKDPEELFREELRNSFKIIVTQVASAGFDENWLGRKIDVKAIEDLKILNKKFGVHIGFEGGEAESLVLDCPLFKKKLVIDDFEKIWDKKIQSGKIVVKSAHLESKDTS